MVDWSGLGLVYNSELLEGLSMASNYARSVSVNMHGIESFSSIQENIFTQTIYVSMVSC